MKVCIAWGYALLATMLALAISPLFFPGSQASLTHTTILITGAAICFSMGDEKA